MISSYEAARLHMERARSKTKGRPMKSSGWRLHQDGDEYPVRVYDVEVGRFLPDNTFVFTIDGNRAYSVAHTLSSTMYRNLPLSWFRYAQKKYRVDHIYNIHGQAWQHFAKPTSAPEVYPGLKFDMFTGKCLNAKPDYKPTINEERRREWLAASRAWKRKLKAAARVGVFDKLIADEKRDPTPWTERPRWGDDEWVDILYKAIKDGDCSIDLLRMFVASATSGWDVTSEWMYSFVEDTVKRQSVELRKRFGVFEGE